MIWNPLLIKLKEIPSGVWPVCLAETHLGGWYVTTEGQGQKKVERQGDVVKTADAGRKVKSWEKYKTTGNSVEPKKASES